MDTITLTMIREGTAQMNETEDTPERVMCETVAMEFRSQCDEYGSKGKQKFYNLDKPKTVQVMGESRSW